MMASFRQERLVQLVVVQELARFVQVAVVVQLVEQQLLEIVADFVAVVVVASVVCCCSFAGSFGSSFACFALLLLARENV